MRNDSCMYDAMDGMTVRARVVQQALVLAQVTRLVEGAYAAKRIIAAVCHGPAALLDANGAEGKPLVMGKQARTATSSLQARPACLVEHMKTMHVATTYGHYAFMSLRRAMTP